MKIIAFYIIFIFALFLIFIGVLMFIKPKTVKHIIAKAGSSYLYNFLELIPRLIIGIAFVFVESKFTFFLKYFGYFLILTALLIMLLPIKFHHKFSIKASNFLSPMYLRLASPISILFGAIILYAIL